jgi:hypothetical protein
VICATSRGVWQQFVVQCGVRRRQHRPAAPVNTAEQRDPQLVGLSGCLTGSQDASEPHCRRRRVRRADIGRRRRRAQSDEARVGARLSERRASGRGAKLAEPERRAACIARTTRDGRRGVAFCRHIFFSERSDRRCAAEATPPANLGTSRQPHVDALASRADDRSAALNESVTRRHIALCRRVAADRRAAIRI